MKCPYMKTIKINKHINRGWGYEQIETNITQEFIDCKRIECICFDLQRKICLYNRGLNNDKIL